MNNLSEEEKKAIEYLKENLLVRAEKGKIVAVGNAYKLIILNLIENQQKEIEELKEKNKKIEAINYRVNKNLLEAYEEMIPRYKIKAKIEELERRIDYLDKELTEAYIMREKLGTETEIDTNEQYIYNMEQERSIRHTQKRVLQSLLEEE